jgi:hypothetical protein
VAKKKLPPEILEFFRKQGSKGGKKSAASFTPEERSARAKKAVAAVSLTPEQRHARALKAVAAREANRKKAKKAGAQREVNVQKNLS